MQYLEYLRGKNYNYVPDYMIALIIKFLTSQFNAVLRVFERKPVKLIQVKSIPRAPTYPKRLK
jgi:hypothetical protein